LRIIADFLDAGIEKERIYNLIYNNFSVDRMRLQGFSLDKRMIILPRYRTAYIVLTKKDLVDYRYEKGDTEGFVNLPLSITDIDFSTLLIEKDGFIKLSFRSKGTFSVNDFAEKYFSGGGHLNAAGGEYYDSLEHTIDHFLNAVKECAAKLKGKSK
jgi:bifunctional oligoribonuclease and PAP phosphatase NrnA